MMAPPDPQFNASSETRPVTGTPHKLLRLTVCTVVILAGLATAVWLVRTKPRVNRQPPVSLAPLVRTVTLQTTAHQLRVPATGTIVPARQIVIKVPVAGEIVKVSPEFTEGGVLAAGDEMLQIDRTDYELLVRQKQRAVSEAEYAAKLEEGRQEVARREWQLLYGDTVPLGPESDLALRRPHLEKIRLDLESARAELEQARLNLSRTLVLSPFNALVLRKYVALGSQVSAQEKLAELVDTDNYWAQVTLPADQLKWLQIPRRAGDQGSPALVTYREGNVRQGRVLRLLADLSSEGRMARLLIAIADPLHRQGPPPRKPPLLLGEYVRVEIAGAVLPDVIRLPRTALRNDREVWLLSPENRLDIRPVTTVWRDADTVLVKDGLQPGEQLIVSELATPVAGMALRQELPSTAAGSAPASPATAEEQQQP
jgi:RND family efflux transporter MFP subunit